MAPIELSAREFEALVAFVRDGLLDERAKGQSLCALIPKSVPSGYPTMRFEECPQSNRPTPKSPSNGQRATRQGDGRAAR